jgi:hypothetical protein
MTNTTAGTPNPINPAPDGSPPVVVGGGGRIYSDSRMQDQLRAARAAGMLDQPPWADHPESEDDRRPPPDPEPKKQPEPAPPPPQTPPVTAKKKREWDRRELTSTGIELAGMLCLAGGGFVIHVWLGLFIAGLCLIAIGVLTSRRFDS